MGNSARRCHGALYKVFGGLQKTNESVPKDWVVPSLKVILPLLAKHHVETTVREFVTALSLLRPALNIWVLPVCPHVHRSDKNGKAVGRAARRQVTQQWNEQLRRVMPCDNVKLVDYEKDLLGDTGYVLKLAYNADGTHMNSAFLPCLENALETRMSIL